MHEPQQGPTDTVTPVPGPRFPRRWTDGGSPTWGSVTRVVAGRRVLFAAVFLGFIFAVGLITLLGPKHYTTHVRMITGNPGTSPDTSGTPRTGLPVLNALQLPSAGQTPETYAELFRETPVVRRVIQELRLNTDVGTLVALDTEQRLRIDQDVRHTVGWRRCRKRPDIVVSGVALGPGVNVSVILLKVAGPGDPDDDDLARQ